MVEADSINIYWSNVTKENSNLCRVIFFISKTDKWWLLENNKFWEGEYMYDIPHNLKTNIPAHLGRHIWKKLINENSFYIQQINDKSKQQIKLLDIY